ncbi:MAG: hypothetical protein OXF02_00740 [Simkaniaceae bacterium]|nr:hypothetical protein [Simkaniaceae bacterium]
MKRNKLWQLNLILSLLQKRRTKGCPREKGGRGGKDRFTITISNATLERARDAIFRVRGATLAGLVEKGVAPAIEELAKGRILRDEETGKVIKHKNGPFPDRLLELRSGRSVLWKNFPIDPKGRLL